MAPRREIKIKIKITANPIAADESGLARETGTERLCRTFSAWSHCAALLFAQLTHALGLNDVCDSLRLHSGPLSAVRGATPPSRNHLSHANRQRPAALGEKLFWAVLAHLQNLSPAFAAGGRGGRRLAHRFKAAIHVVDATTIEHLFALQERGEARGEDEHLRFHGGRDRAITTRVCHVRVSSLGKNLMQDLD